MSTFNLLGWPLRLAGAIFLAGCGPQDLESSATAIRALEPGGRAQDSAPYEEASETYPVIADSVEGFSDTQGYDGWSYGYAANPYSAGSFQPMTSFWLDGTWSAETDGAAARLSATGGFVASGEAGSPERLPVRRWVSEIEEKVQISGQFQVLQAGTSEGSLNELEGSIYADGRLLWTDSAYSDELPTEFSIPFYVWIGTKLDFVVAGAPASSGSAFRFSAQIGQGGCARCCYALPPIRYTQRTLPWGVQNYDHKTDVEPRHTIGDVGCSLTSLSMALYYAGVPNDPGTLNSIMAQANGYDKAHNVVWRPAVDAVRVATGKNVIWRDLITSNTSDLVSILCNGALPLTGSVFNVGFPVVVGVDKRPAPGKPFEVNHFVLVTKYNAEANPDEISIFDPGNLSIGSLDAYNNQFEARGYVIDPELVGSLNIGVTNASLRITDSLGRTTGYDSDSGIVSEIPQSVAYRDALDGDILQEPADEYTTFASVVEPAPGSFNLEVTGGTGGQQILSILSYAQDGTPKPEVTLTLEVPPGIPLALGVNYAPDSAAPTVLDQCPDDPDKSDPGQCGCGVADEDGDGDGACDVGDGCPNDPQKIAPGICGCGSVDTDGDGDQSADCVDECPTDTSKTTSGVCGCGIADTDSDGDAAPDCTDACPSDATKTAPGICDCNVSDTDSDGDDLADCVDTCPMNPSSSCGGEPGDDDGDGVEDARDRCAATVAGGLVDRNGCSIDQRCPCADSPHSREWSHRAYVACVERAAEAFRRARLLSPRQVRSIVHGARRSGCGRRR